MEGSRVAKSEYWRAVPAWKNVDQATFADPFWQERNCVTSVEDLGAKFCLAKSPFLNSVKRGLAASGMALRMTPHTVALIDWQDPVRDVIRRQFLPLIEDFTVQHPLLRMDSLGERRAEIAPGLVHRYPDRALFLVVDTCPVYCRFCTRSYSVGADTEQITKVHYTPNRERWREGIAAIAANPNISDVVISGGDAFRLKASQLEAIVKSLCDIGHLRHIRLATKGLSVLPMKILIDEKWTAMLVSLVRLARSRNIDLVVHTHINHPNEITTYTAQAAQLLFQEAVTVRNQSVLLRGVNDNLSAQRMLHKTLGDLQIRGYYTYVCDPVLGIDDLRTSVAKAKELEVATRGFTAGFNMPTFVVDLPGGGGKRDVHSHHYYDSRIGLSVYTAPAVTGSKVYLYPDPLHALEDEVREGWKDPHQAAEFVASAFEALRGKSHVN